MHPGTGVRGRNTRYLYSTALSKNIVCAQWPMLNAMARDHASWGHGSWPRGRRAGRDAMRGGAPPRAVPSRRAGARAHYVQSQY